MTGVKLLAGFLVGCGVLLALAAWAAGAFPS
jgi:hypothetical protein